MKLGLVLEGGAMRGVFTAGVLDTFLDHGIGFDFCYGVSAGACLACSYLCAQKERGYHVMTDYLENKDYCSFSSLVRTGDLFGAEFLYHTIPEQLYPIDNDAYLKNNTCFYSVVTDCNSGKAEYLQVRDMFHDVDMIRASASLPLVSRIVKIDGGMYLDGGVADPIPVGRALDDGCDRIVVVLTRHREYRKGKEKTVPLMKLKYRNFPKLVSAMEKRPQVYNDTLEKLARWESEGKVMILAPEQPLQIRRTEKNREVLRRGYEQGRSLAESSLSALNAFLTKE